MTAQFVDVRDASSMPLFCPTSQTALLSASAVLRPT
jgi:hypothetical protein